MLLLIGGTEWFTKGGWAMYPLLLLSIWSVYVIFSRLAYFATTQRRIDRDLEGLLRGAAVLPERLEGELPPLLARALKQGQLDVTRAEGAVERELQLASQGVSSLDTIAQIGPMFGLLGTVSGMITVFFNIAQVDGGINVSVLSSGISEALIATWSGLAVAIPAFIAFRAFRGRLLALENRYYSLVDDVRQMLSMRGAVTAAGQPALRSEEQAQVELTGQRHA